MDKYIEGNKAAWEEAFENKDASWGADITERVQTAKGVGFDIAENQVAFANEKAKELGLPCVFEAVIIYDIDDRYREQLDVALITIGALCWFDDLNRFFAVVAKCMKPGAVIVINEQHPFTNMLATEGEELFNQEYRTACHYSYFEHEWTGNEGMYYMRKKTNGAKTGRTRK